VMYREAQHTVEFYHRTPTQKKLLRLGARSAPRRALNRGSFSDLARKARSGALFQLQPTFNLIYIGYF
jgi:hypothetical protein